MSPEEIKSLPEGQQDAIAVLLSIAQASKGALTVDLDYVELGGVLIVQVYLSSASLLPSAGLLLSEKGIKLEDWEPINISIGDDFPYSSPIASTGRSDFPEIPHQPRGSRFCVRVEPNNWDPSAGMNGFIRAVVDTYQRIALGTLQGHLQSWRPVTATYSGKGYAVIKADLPEKSRISEGTSSGWAVGIPVDENRIDIIEWLDVNGNQAAADLTQVLSEEFARLNAKVPGAFLVAAVVAARPIAVEYCRSWEHLRLRLREQGVDWRLLLGHLVRAATISKLSSEAPGQAALLFRVAADTGPTAEDQDARFAVARLTQRDVELFRRILARKTGALGELFPQRALPGAVPWVQVYDGRPESMLRRTSGQPTDKLARARILLLGCGGLGAPIAEHCVRSGAARLHIVDSGTVSPGVLSRQPYEDADIGKDKATVLAARLARIRPENEVTALVADIPTANLFSALQLAEWDLIIDATANRSVAAWIERAQRDQHDSWPPLVTVAISQQATHGVAAVTPRGTVGASIDLLRQLGLRTRKNTALGDVYAAFFPPEASKLNFRPDTSCSDTTFIGSTTDMGALAAQLLDGALARVDLQSDPTRDETPHRSLSIVRVGTDDELKPARAVLDLPSDRVVMDSGQPYEVRIDQDAMETIRGYVRASVNGRIPGAGHTGGLLIGQFDSACRIAWVSRATGLPPGSTVDPLRMSLDNSEVRDFLQAQSSGSGGMLTLIGCWHTHRGGSAEPSGTDRETMRHMAAGPSWRSAPALLLVLSVPADGSVGESPSPWLPEIHAETFQSEFGPADGGQENEQDGRH